MNVFAFSFIKYRRQKVDWELFDLMLIHAKTLINDNVFRYLSLLSRNFESNRKLEQSNKINLPWHTKYIFFYYYVL